MAYDLEEQEKLEALRAWWERYGTLLVALAVAVAIGVLGWRGWQWYQGNKAVQAMGYFEALELAVAEPGDEAQKRIKAASETLRKDFPKSGYASRGALLAAHTLAERGDAAGAAEQLRWVMQGKDPALAGLARLRLAGLELGQKRYDEALALLKDPPAGFEGLYADRRGDVLYARGEQAQAREAWEAALKALAGDPLVQVVQLKIDALAGA